MNRERILNFITAIAIFVMMAYIGFGLARQFDPQEIIHLHTHPAYTNESYERQERELAHFKYEWKRADGVLMDIVRAGR